MGRSSVKGGGSMKTTFNQNNFSKVAFCSQNRKTTALKPKHENTRKVQTVRVRRRICDKVMTALISMIVICVAVYIAYRYELADYLPQYKYIRKLKVLIIAPENDKTINHVFENLGYDRVHDINDNWDVLWSTTADPFNLYAEYMTKLKPHQLVNHFPFPPELTHHMSHMIGGGRGSWEFNKKHHQEYILRSFKLPEAEKELIDYEKESQQFHKRFIIRDCLVNGLKVINANDDINYNASLVLQELPDNLLYINDAILELGVYVLMSSVNPLRIYRYNDDADVKLLYTTPGHSKYFCINPQMTKDFNKKSINSYLNTNGYNATFLHENIDKAIVSFLMINEQNIVNRMEEFKVVQLQQFIQLIRFNFIMDTKLNVYVRNVETFLNSSGIEDYGRIIYSALNVVGAGNYYEFMCRNDTSCPLLSQPKDIVAFPNSCTDSLCKDSSGCSSSKCELCSQCLNQVPNALNHIYQSYRENMHCGHMKRIFPSQNNFHDTSKVNQLSSINRLSLKWFEAMCKSDSSWC